MLTNALVRQSCSSLAVHERGTRECESSVRSLSDSIVVHLAGCRYCVTAPVSIAEKMRKNSRAAACSLVNVRCASGE